MTRRTTSILLLVAIGLVASAPAFGWGDAGHKIVAKIAWRFLTPEARTGVLDLLDGKDLVTVATWADDVRSKRPKTGPWHYVNVPRDASTVDADRDCAEKGCAIGAIHEQLDVLKSSAPREARVEALKFLVHFVGDIHQPLHVSYADDRGGNEVSATFFGHEASLHGIWDSEMIQKRTGAAWWKLAESLADDIEPSERSAWEAQLDPVEWANESLAETIAVYDHFEEAGEHIEYEADEYERDIRIVEGRLAMAGVRLAAMLNAVFAAPTDALAASAPALSICSFNIQFLGNGVDRDMDALADVVAGNDIVVVQELLAPPFPGTYPNGDPFKPDPEARTFFEAMASNGFSWRVSEEDTGTGDTIHWNSSATEWWVAFYKPARVKLAEDLHLTGFLADDRSNHPDYERVPYAFAFRSADNHADFVLISVHLQPNPGTANKARRKHELATIGAWIDAHDNGAEKDFIVLGDMNIQSATELAQVTPTALVTLNDECRPTNTNVNSPKPYDHVMYRRQFTSEIDEAFDLNVVDLVAEMAPRWNAELGSYPGSPYQHDRFRKYYSDHDPVIFQLRTSAADDD